MTPRVRRSAVVAPVALGSLLALHAGVVGCAADAAAPAPLAIESFDVVEKGWGDAPLPVHFAWSVRNAQGTLTCKLDADGDGVFEREASPCDADTLAVAPAALPSFTFVKRGEYRPRLVVSDGERSVEATTKVFANELVWRKTTVRPETLPGFVKADVTSMTKVVLTFADAAKLPVIKVGEVLWGTSGSGYLMRVDAVARSGATTTLTGRPAKLTDALEQGFFGARDVVAPMNDPKCVDAACAGATFERLSPRGGLGTKAIGRRADGLSLDTSVEVRDEDFTLFVPLPKVAGVTQSLKVGVLLKELVVDVGVDVGWGGIEPKVNRVVVDLRPSVAYSASVKVASKTLLDKNLGRFVLGTIPLGPIVVTPMLVPAVRVDASVSVQASLGIAAPIRIELRDGSWTKEFKPSFDPAAEMLDPNGASVGGEVSVSFVPKINAALMGLGGPYVALSASLVGGVDLRTAPASDLAKCGAPVQACLGLKTRLSGEYGAEIPYLDGANVHGDFTIAERTLAETCLGKPDGAGNCPDAGAPSDAGPASDAGGRTDAGGGDAAAACPTSGPPGKPECAKCEHALCTSGSALAPTCSECARKVCAADDYCCTQGWTLSCMQKANELCAAGCKI
jgi:hypothetical protein